MGSILQILVIYVFVCMSLAAIVTIQNMKMVVEKISPTTRYTIFIIGLVLTVLTSPFWMPKSVVRVIRALWKEIVDKCRLLDGDHQ